MQCNTSMHSHLNLPCLFVFSAMLGWEPKSCMTCCTTTRRKCCFWRVAQQFARRWQRRLECGTWSLSATELLHQPCQTGKQKHSSQGRLGGRMESNLLNVSETFSPIAFRPSEAHLLKDAENFWLLEGYHLNGAELSSLLERCRII